jgi:hypothetical protein
MHHAVLNFAQSLLEKSNPELMTAVENTFGHWKDPQLWNESFLKAKLQKECLVAERAIAASSTPPPPSGPQYQFLLKDGFWHLRFGNERGVYADTKGLQRIATLLQQPDKSISAYFLVHGNEDFAAIAHSTEVAIGREGKADAEQRMQELKKRIQDAKENLERELEAELQEEFDDLGERLKAARGRRGKPRRINRGSPAEKAADAVRKSIDYVIEKLREPGPDGYVMPNLANHLTVDIRPENVDFTYRPAAPYPWQFF